jgi:hypothetical protein
MAKHKSTTSPETISDAEAIAKATQRPGQSKAQTKLIAKGIEKGITEYKKRQKSKARELDKKIRKVKSTLATQESDLDETESEQTAGNSNTLPLILLALSWAGFIAYILITQFNVI